MKKLFYLGLVFLIPSCVLAQQIDSEEMYQKASALTKLSKAVEATVRYKHPPEGISDKELIDLSTKDDPSLQEPFKDDVVKVLWHDRHSIVLVCSEDERGLLEDSACTAELDKHLWKEAEAQCDFTLQIEIVCE